MDDERTRKRKSYAGTEREAGASEQVGVAEEECLSGQCPSREEQARKRARCLCR